MGGKGRKRREKNYMAAHGGNNRLPPPPTTSSLNALPSKLRKIISFTSSTPQDPGNTKRNSKREDANENKPRSETKLESKSSGTKDERDKKLIMTQVTDEKREDVISDTNEEKKKKKRKRKQVNDLRFEAEMEKLGAISKRRQRKKEYLKAKKKKHKKGNSDQMLDLPKRDEIKFGEVVQGPPKLVVVPKAPKKPLDASRERVRLQAIESYRSRKGWTSRPGIHLPPVCASPDV